MFKHVYGSKMDILQVMSTHDLLYGYVLTIETKNLQIMEFLYSNSECLDLKQIIHLFKCCQKAGWSEAVLFLLSSQITKT